ncbi:MAG: hypothetical protein ABSC95_14285 [Acetobacteraceae bacterium]
MTFSPGRGLHPAVSAATSLPLSYRPHPFLAVLGDIDVAPTIRLIYVIRSLIDYGRALRATLSERASSPDFASFVRPLGSADLRTLFSRIAAALHRAILLCHGLEDQHRGRNQAERHPPSPSPRSPRTGGPSDPATTRPARPVADARPQDRQSAPLPSTADLADELRRRPIAEVIAGICRDFGIPPNHPLWRDLYRAIVACGNNPEAMDRQAQEPSLLAPPPGAPAADPPGIASGMAPAPGLQPTAIAATGPPRPPDDRSVAA